MDERYHAFRDQLRMGLPDRLVIEDYLRRLAYGTDASFYRLIPKLVVKVRDEADLTLILDAANRYSVPVTFRAAGTSLSGQAVTDSVLAVMDGDAWRDHSIARDADVIRLQPGIIGAQANALLAPLGRKIGPDPASIGTAKIGGIAANNASGMCCGVEQNSYHTLAEMRVILVDGTLLDTGDPESRSAFARSHGHVLSALTGLTKRVRDNEVLAERIRRKFSIKNTTGYSLNALVDFEDPFEILQHLMIGSEGTLGFIAEVTYHTVPEHPCKASNLVFFPDVESACRAADGLCATRCPVGIDTGAMMKRLRAADQGPAARKVGCWVERHMGGAAAATRLGMGTVSALSRLTGPDVLEKSTSGIRRLSGNRLPTWDRWMPRSAGSLRAPARISSATAKVVYLPSCASRSMGAAVCDTEKRDLQGVTLSLLAKAGFDVVIPDGVKGLCCGMPFASKGLEGPARSGLVRTEAALWTASEQGRLPVLCDTSPCVTRMIEGFTSPIRIQEPVGFVLEHLLPHLRQVRKQEKVALHITCSARKMGLESGFTALAETCADQVFQPEQQGCCGFGGEKGFTTPELNAAALSRLKQQLPDGCESGYSNSRTCEIGLSRHSGIPYRSILYLVDQCFESGEIKA
jgi:Fe-S oxidoreductase